MGGRFGKYGEVKRIAALRRSARSKAAAQQQRRPQSPLHGRLAHRKSGRRDQANRRGVLFLCRKTARAQNPTVKAARAPRDSAAGK